jgi:hypothetical protein
MTQGPTDAGSVLIIEDCKLLGRVSLPPAAERSTHLMIWSSWCAKLLSEDTFRPPSVAAALLRRMPTLVPRYNRWERI